VALDHSARGVRRIMLIARTGDMSATSNPELRRDLTDTGGEALRGQGSIIVERWMRRV
jgi:hypothetical protein